MRRRIRLCRVPTERGTECCGNPERHERALHLALEDIGHSRTRTRNPQTNGIAERFHKTVPDAFCRLAFRRKVSGSIAELQADLDAWIAGCNGERAHQGTVVLRQDAEADLILTQGPLAREKTIAA